MTKLEVSRMKQPSKCVRNDFPSISQPCSIHFNRFLMFFECMGIKSLDFIQAGCIMWRSGRMPCNWFVALLVSLSMHLPKPAAALLTANPYHIT